MKKVTLVLSSGGARGFAHIGVLKTLQKNKIIPDRIIGSSVGSLVGAFFCKFADYNKVEEILINFNWKDLSHLFDPNLKSGLFGGKKLRKQLNIFLENSEFKDLKIPLEIVATNFFTAQPVYFSKGNLASSIQASIAFPIIIEPLKENGDIFWDGGLSDPLPTERVKKDNNLIIAVNLNKYPGFYSQRITYRQKIDMAISSLQHQLSIHSAEKADILLEPKFKEKNSISDFIRFLRKDDAERIIKKGSEATEKKISLIKEKINEI